MFCAGRGPWRVRRLVQCISGFGVQGLVMGYGAHLFGTGECGKDGLAGIFEVCLCIEFG